MKRGKNIHLIANESLTFFLEILMSLKMVILMKVL